MACDDMAGDEEEKLEGESTVQRMDLTFYGVGQRCLNSWLAVFHKSCGNVGETRQPRPGSGTASGSPHGHLPWRPQRLDRNTRVAPAGPGSKMKAHWTLPARHGRGRDDPTFR